MSDKQDGTSLSPEDINNIATNPEKYGYKKIESYKNLPGQVMSKSGEKIEDKEAIKKVFHKLTKSHTIYHNEKLGKSLYLSEEQIESNFKRSYSFRFAIHGNLTICDGQATEVTGGIIDTSCDFADDVIVRKDTFDGRSFWADNAYYIDLGSHTMVGTYYMEVTPWSDYSHFYFDAAEVDPVNTIEQIG